MSGEETSRTPTNQLVRAGLEEQSQARRTGEPTHYTRSERALRQALAQDPNDIRALIGLASLANTRHHFREGLALARRVRSLAPDMALAYGVMGDALVELGRFEAGYRAYEKMAELKPSIAAYARVAQAQAGLGESDSARRTIHLALDSAVDAETRGFLYVELGRLDRVDLRFAAAAGHFRNALAVSPGNPLALEAWGETEAARGNLKRAIALQRQAVAHEVLAGVRGFAGGHLHRRRAAEGGREGVRPRAAAGAAGWPQNGVDTDVDRAMFQLEHGIDLPGSLVLARRGYAQRPGTEASEVLSWALVRNGRCKEAVRYSDQALRFPDGHRYFHRGMIESCLGRKAAAQRLFRQALDTDPNFSPIWARFARMQLD